MKDDGEPSLGVLEVALHNQNVCHNRNTESEEQAEVFSEGSLRHRQRSSYPMAFSAFSPYPMAFSAYLRWMTNVS